MTDFDDHELVRRTVAGDRAAFRVLYDRYLPRVTRQVGRMIGRRGDVEDVVQDVFIQMHRSLPRFRYDSELSTWLYRLTSNVTISYLRKRKMPSDLPALRNLAAPGSAWSKLAAREQLRALYAALDETPAEHRKAFVHFEIEGMSLKDIAELEGVSLNTIASRVRRTRERLRQLLELAQPDVKRRAGGQS